MTLTTHDIREKVENIVQSGDERALRDFFVKNFKDLPENTQKKVLFAVFEETLEKSSGDAEILRIQEAGLHAIDELEAFKAMLAKA